MLSLTFHNISALLARDLQLSNLFLSVFWKAKGETEEHKTKYFDWDILIKLQKLFLKVRS